MERLETSVIDYNEWGPGMIHHKCYLAGILTFQ